MQTLKERIAQASRLGITLLIIGLIGGLLFFVGQMVDSYLLRMVSKPIPVLCMIIWVLSSSSRDRYQIAIASGLILSLGGDILLEASPGTFLPGLISFLCGHIAYIYAFSLHHRRAGWGRALLAYAYGAGIYLILFFGGDMGDLAIPVLLYVIVICTMLWRAASRVGAESISPRSARNALIGALLFAFSDTILALNRFLLPFAFARYLNITTYWLGQWGISLSTFGDQGQ